MALRTVAIVASLLVLAAIHIRGEGNQEKDTHVKSSHLNQASNTDLQEAPIKSRILRSAGKRRHKGQKNASRKKPNAGRKVIRRNQKGNKVRKEKSHKKKIKRGKHTRGKKRKQNNKNKKKKNKTKKGRKGKVVNKGNKSGKKKKCNRMKNKDCKRKGKKQNRNDRKHKRKNCINGKCRKGGKEGNRNGKKVRGKKSNAKAKKHRDKKKPIRKQKKILRKKKVIVKFRAAVCENCVVKLANYAKLYVAQAKNRKQQILRMEAACKTSKKKVEKKELFNDPYQKLLENAGGNKSDPKCKGQSIGKSRGSNDTAASDGAASVADLTTLEACNKSIEDNCNACQLDDPIKAKDAADCKKAMVSFISKMDNCLNVTKYADQAALCSCVDGIDDANKTLEKQIRGCGWVTAASAQEVINKKTCVGEFAKCRKAEDATVGHIHKCKLPLLKCGGVTTVDQAKIDLPILKNLKTELDATEVKMKAGFTNNGLPAVNTSSDSKTPSGLSDFIKNPSGGSRAVSKCRQLAQAFLKFNESAKTTGESANDNLNGTEASNTTDILEKMKTRDFDSEVADCQKSTKLQTVLYGINRFYAALLILWRTTVVDVKIVVLTLVISNEASDDSEATTAAAAGATTAAAGATTAAAAATTAAAGATTAAAGATTAAAGATTAAAGATTAAAADTTAAAADTTAAAADTTAAVADTTAAAADTTAAVVTARAQGRKKKFLDRMQWLKQKVLKS